MKDTFAIINKCILIQNIKNAIPNLASIPTVCYTVPNVPCIIYISKPEPFNNYMDIIAHVTVIYDGEIIVNNLIGFDTNFEAFSNKIAKRIQEKRRVSL